jgi:hypothetical protein
LRQLGVEEILNNAGEPVKTHLGAAGLESIRQETSRHYERYARLGDRIIRNFVQFLKVY